MEEKNESIEIQPALYKRLEYVDGIKGIAAILVVLCHLVCVFLPEFYRYSENYHIISRIWILTPLNIFTNGAFPVECFFVLSGFLITRKIYQSSEKSALAPLHKKCVGMAKIVIPAVILAFLLMELGLMFHLQAAQINGKLSFVNDYNAFDANWKNLLLELFIDPYLEGSRYVGPLWTIRYELQGSIFIALLAYGARSLKEKGKYSYLLVGLLFLLIQTKICSFIMGGFIAHTLYYLDEDTSLVGKLFKKIAKCGWLKATFALIFFYFATTNLYFTSIWSFWPKVLNYVRIAVAIPELPLRPFGIAGLLFIVATSPKIQRLFSFKLFVWLGKLSPFVYAFHWQLILSLGCGLFVLLNSYIPYHLLVVIISIIILGGSIALSYGYIKITEIVKKKIKNRKAKKLKH